MTPQEEIEKRLTHKKSAIKETTESSLDAMLKCDPVLYNKISDTTGFAYYFNQLCLIAQTGEMQQAIEQENKAELESLRKENQELKEAAREVMRFEASMRTVMGDRLVTPNNFIKALDQLSDILTP